MSTENEQDGHKQEKLSLRKELKRKCQEQYLLPVNNKDIPRLSMVPDSFLSLPLPKYGLAGQLLCFILMYVSFTRHFICIRSIPLYFGTELGTRIQKVVQGGYV